jgi:hypothetical protein
MSQLERKTKIMGNPNDNSEIQITKKVEEDFSKVSTAIGHLKKAAIDAYMRDVKGFKLEGGKYTHKTPNTHVGGSMDSSITAPDAEGNNGGEGAHMGQLADWRSEFDAIRRKIDTAIDPWTKLPQIEPILAAANRFQSSASKVLFTSAMDAGGTLAQGNHMPGGLIGGQLENVERMISAMRSDMLTAFANTRLLPIKAVIQNLSYIPRLCCGALWAEAKVYQGAKATVLRVIKETTNRFNVIASADKAPNMSVPMEILKQAIEAYSIVADATNAPATIAKTLKFALGAVTGVNEKIEKSEQGKFDGAMNDFLSSFEDINKTVTAIENDLDASFTTNYSSMDSNRAAYDIKLSYDNFDPELTPQKDMLQIDRASVDVILNTLYRGTETSRRSDSVTAKLSSSRADANAVDVYPVLEKPTNIGNGHVSRSLSELQRRYVKLVENLVWDIENAGKDLDLGVELIFSEDRESVKREWEPLRKRIQGGDPKDPWGNDMWEWAFG